MTAAPSTGTTNLIFDTTPMPDPLPVHLAVAAVMEDVTAVAKRDRHSGTANFMFRGIDAVMNAVGPALRKHRVVVVPHVNDVTYTDVTTSGGKASTACRVNVTYTFYGPAGDTMPVTVVGEAWDSGDKATPKAMSVAFRTALLQSLTLPTDEPDPDHAEFVREAAPAINVQTVVGEAVMAQGDVATIRNLYLKVAEAGALSAAVQVPDDNGEEQTRQLGPWLVSLAPPTQAAPPTPPPAQAPPPAPSAQPAPPATRPEPVKPEPRPAVAPCQATKDDVRCVREDKHDGRHVYPPKP